MNLNISGKTFGAVCGHLNAFSLQFLFFFPELVYTKVIKFYPP